jgi:hypothetical protein
MRCIIRKATTAEDGQLRIYNALQLNHDPGGIKKYKIAISEECSA